MANQEVSRMECEDARRRDHPGQIIAPGTLGTILRQAGLTVDQFRALL